MINEQKNEPLGSLTMRICVKHNLFLICVCRKHKSTEITHLSTSHFSI